MKKLPLKLAIVIWQFFKKHLVLIFFIVLFLLGNLLVPHYGVSWDELTEVETTFINLKSIYQQFKIPIPEAWQSYPDLDTYKDRHYGVALQLIPTIPAIINPNLPINVILMLRHYFTFNFFFASVLCFYFLVRRFYARKKECLLALLPCLFLILSPRIFAESFFNLKDIFFLSTVIFSVYTGLNWLDKSTDIKRIMLFALAASLMINTRVAGGLIVLIFLAAFIIKSWRQKVSWKKLLLIIGGAILSVILISILLTPASWKNFLTYFWENISLILNFPLNTELLYRGQFLSSQQLPADYLPVWIIITTPWLYLILTALGLKTNFISWRKIEAKVTTLYRPRFLIAAIIFVFVAIVVIARPHIYDGWRHFYFLLPLILIFSLDGLCYLWRIVKKWHHLARPALVVIVTINCLVLAAWMFKNHPHQYLYFSLPLRTWSLQNFTKERWNLTYAQLLKELLERDSQRPLPINALYIYDQNVSLEPGAGLIQNLAILSPDQQKAFVITDQPKYVLYFSRNQRSATANVTGYTMVKSLSIDGFTVSGIMRKTP